MNTWLPESYERPASPSRYFKFEQGDNKFRILSKPVVGWEDWTPDRKPVRTPEKPTQAIDPKRPPKHFWAFIVWSYRDNDIRVMELTQATIQDAIIGLHKDENWGDPTTYDINVKKSGEKMETKYNVVPTPPKPLAEEISMKYLATKVDLNKLFANEDPFIGDAKEVGIDTSQIPF